MSKKKSAKKRNIITSDNNISSDTRNAFLQFNSWRIVPLTEDGADRLAASLFEWFATDQEALCFDEFLVIKRLSACTYYKWKAKFPRLQEMHEWVMMALGARREKGALTNKLNSLIVRYTMPYYSPDMKELVKFYADIKKPDDEILEASRVIVKMSTYPFSDMVPNKRESSE
jgi:hypothetical protein